MAAIGTASDFFADGESAAALAFKSRCSGVIDIRAAAYTPFLQAYAYHILGTPELTDPLAILDRLYDHMNDNNLKVKSRGFSYGSASYGGSNNGNGQLIRVTTDQRGFAIESCHAEVKTFKCVQDQNSGAVRGQELFEIRGENAGRDSLGRTQSGLKGFIQALTFDSGGLLDNAGFRVIGGTASVPTSIPSWASTATVNATNFNSDATNFFRRVGSDGDTIYALNVKATTVLSQSRRITNSNFNRNAPYVLAAIWNAQVGSGIGTLKVTLGSKDTGNISVDGTGPDTGWRVTLLPVSPGQNSWPINFTNESLDVEISWTKTSGEFLLGEVILAPLIGFDQTFYAILPKAAAAYKDWLLDDSATVTDTIASDSIIQRHIAESFPGKMLPHGTGSAVTWLDPT